MSNNTPADCEKNWLWDVQNDPTQQTPLHDENLEAQRCKYLQELMRRCDAPNEQFARLGL